MQKSINMTGKRKGSGYPSKIKYLGSHVDTFLMIREIYKKSEKLNGDFYCGNSDIGFGGILWMHRVR